MESCAFAWRWGKIHVSGRPGIGRRLGREIPLSNGGELLVICSRSSLDGSLRV
jgi:hypothetical protein